MDFIAKNVIVGAFIGLMCLLFAGLKWLAKKREKKKLQKKDLRTREEKRNRFN